LVPTARVDRFEKERPNSFVVPLVVRWLLPIVTAIALLGTTMTSFAAAGFIADSSCCCPDPDTCKCHHDETPPPVSTMKRCEGTTKLVAPNSVVATLTEPVAIASTTTVVIVEHATPPKLTAHVTRPEKPPF
jgi:hypothetical protein